LFFHIPPRRGTNDDKRPSGVIWSQWVSEYQTQLSSSPPDLGQL